MRFLGIEEVEGMQCPNCQQKARLELLQLKLKITARATTIVGAVFAATNNFVELLSSIQHLL